MRKTIRRSWYGIGSWLSRHTTTLDIVCVLVLLTLVVWSRTTDASELAKAIVVAVVLVCVVFATLLSPFAIDAYEDQRRAAEKAEAKRARAERLGRYAVRQLFLIQHPDRHADAAAYWRWLWRYTRYTSRAHDLQIRSLFEVGVEWHMRGVEEAFRARHQANMRTGETIEEFIDRTTRPQVA